MEEVKHRIVHEGNAFYEIDLECMRQKEKSGECSHERENRETNSRYPA